MARACARIEVAPLAATDYPIELHLLSWIESTRATATTTQRLFVMLVCLHFKNPFIALYNARLVFKIACCIHDSYPKSPIASDIIQFLVELTLLFRLKQQPTRRLFGFVSRKTGSILPDNECHLFAADSSNASQSADAIVQHVIDVLERHGHAIVK